MTFAVAHDVDVDLCAWWCISICHSRGVGKGFGIPSLGDRMNFRGA
jgi:hypothetical protein